MAAVHRQGVPLDSLGGGKDGLGPDPQSDVFLGGAFVAQAFVRIVNSQRGEHVVTAIPGVADAHHGQDVLVF